MFIKQSSGRITCLKEVDQYPLPRPLTLLRTVDKSSINSLNDWMELMGDMQGNTSYGQQDSGCLLQELVW